MSEMGGVSGGSGRSADAPTSNGQPSVAGDQIASAPEESSLEVASIRGGPPPAAGAAKWAEPGRASAPKPTDSDGLWMGPCKEGARGCE